MNRITCALVVLLTAAAATPSLGADYHAYVHGGGGLWVGQPNFQAPPHDPAVIPWVPYHLALSNWNDGDDCPSTVVDPTHCITAGLPGDEFPMAADWALAVDAEWTVLLEGGVTGRP